MEKYGLARSLSAPDSHSKLEISRYSLITLPISRKDFVLSKLKFFQAPPKFRKQTNLPLAFAPFVEISLFECENAM